MPQPPSLTESTITLGTTSERETRRLAAALASVAVPGDLICLWGELGAGKTVLAKGFGLGLGVADLIVSPTFVLMAEYPARVPLFHLDLYRLADAADVLAGGLLDERQAAGVTLVEWPERLGAALPLDRLDVRLDGTGDDPRVLTVSTDDAGLARYVKAARKWDAEMRASGGRVEHDAP